MPPTVGALPRIPHGQNQKKKMNFSGYTDWSEGVGPPFFSLIADDEINGNIDLLVVPQYGRNLDHTG